MKKFLLLFLLTTCLFGCEEESVKQTKSNNGEEKLSSNPSVNKKASEPDALPNISLPHEKL